MRSNQDTEEDHASRADPQEDEAHIDVHKTSVMANDFYEDFAGLGMSCGPPFATLKGIQWDEDCETTALMDLHDEQKWSATIY